METPEHYQGENGIQPFDIIDAFKLGFNLGNVIKYVCRAGRKGERLADLRKAKAYLDREIQSELKAGLSPTAKAMVNYPQPPTLQETIGLALPKHPDDCDGC